MILNIRGTHGSGKTYISHKLMDTFKTTHAVEPEEVRGKRFRKDNVHRVGVFQDLSIVGRYQSGMDGIFPQEIIEDMIAYWATRSKHIIWENIVVSANIGRWAELAQGLEHVNHSIWLFMDTPLQVCIDRVFARRAAAREQGFNHRQADSDVKLDVLAGHWRRVRRAAARAKLEGIDVRWIDHTRSYEQAYNLLVLEGEWRPAGERTEIYTHIDVPKTWNPTPEELDYVLKTSKLPWGDPNEMTKVAFRSPAKKPTTETVTIDAFGQPILRWGTNEKITVHDKPVPVKELSVFGHDVVAWEDTIN